MVQASTGVAAPACVGAGTSSTYAARTAAQPARTARVGSRASTVADIAARAAARALPTASSHTMKTEAVRIRKFQSSTRLTAGPPHVSPMTSASHQSHVHSEGLDRLAGTSPFSAVRTPSP